MSSAAAAAVAMDALLLLLLLFLFLFPGSWGLPLCTDSRAPVTLKAPLAFCSYNGSSCCNATDDDALKAQFMSMNISDSDCSSVVKSILCAKCDPFSAELFTVEPTLRTVPVLCNSTVVANSAQSKDSAKDFCTVVWDTCKNVTIRNSPFQPQLQGSAGLPASSSKLTDLWQSKSDFCAAFGGSPGEESLCLDGTTVDSVSFNTTPNSPTPKGMCLEKIGNGSYLNMAAHPDGSNRVFLSNQNGKTWLATVPEEGSGGTLGLDLSNPFLDLTNEVHLDAEFGLMGLAFHPDFTTNGRFFVSFNCDKTQIASCSGRCACNSDVGCDPSKLGSNNGAQPCQYQSVVAEFTVNGSSSTPSTAATANPSEVRRIFTMGLPYTSHHGGQILFGPEDGYLYFMMGDGGGIGDPFNFAQNRRSLLGKIMRLDINRTPSQNEIGLWGNYSIPKDNPFVGDNESQAEIWALGLRNPWRCSFDSARPLYFYCADVGQDTYEEVDLISKGGNYGWRVFEGPYLYHPPTSPGGNTSLSSINPIFPVMGYNHSAVNRNMGSASITGGYVYRSMTDPCMFGRYLYADLYAMSMWAGTEIPENSGNYSSTTVHFSCAKNSPIPCDTVDGSHLPSLGYIYSFGEDNKKDVFLLTSKGVYRVVRPSRCNYACPLEKTTETGTSPSGRSSSASRLKNLPEELVMFLLVFFMLLCFSF